MEDDFKKAAEEMVKLPKKPTDTELLEAYGLYKQVIVGDISVPRPGVTDLKGGAKWDAWNGVKGTGKDEAMQKYVALVDSLKTKYA